MKLLHSFQPTITPEMLLIARALAALSVGYQFQIRGQEFWYREMRVGEWVQLQDVTYWADPVHRLVSPQVALARFVQ